MRNHTAIGRIADLVLVLTMLASGLLLLFSLTRWSPARTTADQWIFFYVLPSAAMAAMALLLTRSEAIRTNVALLFVALGAAGVLTQFTLAIIPDPQLAELGRGVPSTTRTVVEVAEDLRAQGVDAVPRLSASELPAVPLPSENRSLQPLSPGPAHTVTVLCNELADPVTYVSDRDGYNNDDPRPDSVRVLLIGDSFTHGVCVPREEGIAGRLGQRFGGVVNLGLLGSGPLTQLGILREYGAAAAPPVVVWIFYEGNDLADLQTEQNHPVLSRYLESGFRQDLAAYQPEITTHLRAVIDSLMAAGQSIGVKATPGFVSRIRQIDRLRRLIRFGVPFPSRTSRADALGNVMAMAQQEVNAWGGQLLFVYLPTYRRYHMWFGSDPPARREIMAVTDSLGIPVVDLTVEFDERVDDPRTLWTGPAGHLTADGYRVVAEIIGDRVGELP